MTKTLYVTGKLNEEQLYEKLVKYLENKKYVKKIGNLDDVIITGYEEPIKIEIRKT
jgi:hypothetical protein